MMHAVSRAILAAKYFSLITGLCCAGALASRAEVADETADGSPETALSALQNTLRPSTNDFLATAELKELSAALKSLRDLEKLYMVIPPGADAALALEPTLAQFRARAASAEEAFGELMASTLVLGKRAGEQRDDVRRQWIALLIEDPSRRGAVTRAKIGLLGKVRFKTAPRSTVGAED